MDNALCIDDGITYTAVDFSRLSPVELSTKRRALQCIECHASAFFRKASRSGRAACFGARPHAIGCELAAPEYDPNDDGAGDQQDELDNPGERIVIDLAFGAAPAPQVVEAADQPQNRNRRGRYDGDGVRPHARMHRRLSSLLRTLIQVPAFSQSNQIVEIDGHGEIAVRDFFVPTTAVSEAQVNLYRGYWGMLSDARLGADNTLWLNSGGRRDMSFCLSEEHVDAIYARHGVDDEEDFAGAYILVVGTLRASQNGKLYCSISSPAEVALRLAP